MGPGPLSIIDVIIQGRDLILWTAMAAFLSATALEMLDHRDRAIPVAGAGWVLFGVFWLAMFPYFYFEFRSPLEALLSLAGGPLSFYTAYLLVSGRGSILALSRAVGLMGLIYLPATAIEPLRVWLIETVAQQTHFGMELLGYSPGVEEGANGYQSRFAFDGYSTYIVISCTGIGSISIFGGLIASTSAPLRRKVSAFAAAAGVIWILNLARNVFVGLASPLGWFDQSLFVSLTTLLAGDEIVPSYFISHHLISQSLSLVALLGITLLVVRLVPEVVRPLEEVLYILTGDEYDLGDAFGTPTRADGGDAPQR